MDIGTLTGTIAIEDLMTEALDGAANHVIKFAEGFAKEFEVTGEVVLKVGMMIVGTLTSITAGITALGVSGSKINNLSKTMDEFTGSAEKSSEIMEAMRQGTLGTVDDMELMQKSSKLLSTHALENADDFKTMSEAARVLQERGLGSTTQMMDMLTNALVTGRTRQLQMQTGLIDLQAGHEAYAASIGKTVGQLSQLEKKHADQITIMNTLKTMVADSGVQNLTFADYVQVAENAVKNFTDELASMVAKNEVVMTALSGLGNAFNVAFGGTQENALNTITYLVEEFIKLVIQGAIQIVEAVQDITRIWAALEEVIYGVETAIVYVASKLANIFETIIEMGAKVHLFSPQDVADAKNAATVLDGMTESLKQQTLEARNAAEGHGAFQERLNSTVKSLQDTANNLDKTQASSQELSKALNELSENKSADSIRDLNTTVMDLASKGELTTQKTKEVGDALAAMHVKVTDLPPALASLLQAHDNAAAAAKNHGNVLGDTTDKMTTHEKAVQNLILAWTGESEKTKEITEAFNQLTPAQLAYMETTGALIPVVQKLIDAHLDVSDAMMIAYRAEIAARDAVIAHDKEILASKGITEEMIAVQKDLGKSQAEIAVDYGVSTKSLSLYEAELKRAAEAIRNQITNLHDFQTQDQAAHASVAAGFDLTALKQLGQTMGTIPLDAQKINVSMGLIKTGYEGVQGAIDAAMSDAMNRAIPFNSEQQKMVDNMSAAGVSAAEMAKQMNGISLETLIDKLHAGGDSVETIAAKLHLTTEQVVQAAPTMASAWSDALGQIAGMFTQLGQAAGGTLGKIIGGFGQATVLASNAQKATQQLGQQGTAIGGNFGYGSVLFSSGPNAATGTQKMAAGVAAGAAVMQGVSSWEAASEEKDTGARLGGETMAGMQAGAAFGPYGMAVGAAAGFIAGLIKGKPDWAKAQDSMAKDYGVAVSDELSKAIIQTSKDTYKGDVATAELSHLSDIIKEAGGVSDSNLTTLTARLHDVFSAVETGHMTVAQATKVLDDNWGSFVQAGTSGAGVLNKSLSDIIKLQDQFGTQSKAITDYLGQQAQASTKAFGSYLQIGAQAIQTQQQLATSTNATNDQIQRQQEIVDATTIHSQAAADALAAGVASNFQSMMASGMSFGDAIKTIEPAIDGLNTQMAAAGLSGSAVFNTLQSEVALYSDAVAGPALQSVDQLTQGMVALGNTGQMNQDEFAAMTGQIDQTFEALKAQGKDGGAVLIAMKDSIQRVWEEEQDFGYKTDDATQALVDQAVQDGLVGEKHKSVSDQMLDSTNKLVDIMTAMANVMGAKLPAAAEQGAQGVQKALDSIKPPELTVKVGFDDGGGYQAQASYASTGGLVTAQGVVPTQYLAEGGNVLPFVPRGSDTVPAMLTPGERVLSVEQNNDYSQTMEGPSNQEVVDAIDSLRADLNLKLPRALARSLHTGLVGLRTA